MAEIFKELILLTETPKELFNFKELLVLEFERKRSKNKKALQLGLELGSLHKQNVYINIPANAASN